MWGPLDIKKFISQIYDGHDPKSEDDPLEDFAPQLNICAINREAEEDARLSI